MPLRIAILLGVCALSGLGGGCGLVLEGGAYALYLYLNQPEEEDPALAAGLPIAYSGQMTTIGSRRVSVDFQYFLRNPTGGGVDVVAEYSTDDGLTWSAAADGGAPGEGTVDLAAPVAGQSHAFRWNSSSDLPTASNWNAEVAFRITPVDRATGAAGEPWVSLVFAVNVNHAPLCAGITPAGPFPVKVPVTYILLDSEGDAADVAVQFAVSAAGPWTTATRKGSEGEGLTGLTASPTGEVHSFVWDCRADLPSQANVDGLFLRISPQDSASPAFAGAPWVSDAVDGVNHNTAPSISGNLVNPVYKPATSVTIAYTLADAESDPANVAVEYQKNGTGAWIAAVEGAPGSDGTSNLATSQPPGTAHNFVWDFSSETADNLTVAVRISVSDSLYGNSIFPSPPLPWTSNSFQINVLSGVHPSIVSMEEIPTPQCDVVTVRYTLTDSSGHTVNVAVRYSTDGGATWLPASSASEATWDPLSEGVSGLMADSNGEAHVFSWDSFRDLGGADRQGMRLRVISLEAGNFDECSAFSLMNSWTATIKGGSGTTLNGPSAVALDAQGNAYVCDTFGNRVRVLNAQSTSQVFAGVAVPAYSLGVIAGTGMSGYNGDNIPATSAQLNFPRHLALDSATPPNVFVADSLNHRIRRIDGQTGFITTAVGTGVPGVANDGALAPAAEVKAPEALAFDASGNLWIADTGNNQVRFWNRGSASATVFGVAVAPGVLKRISGQANGSSGYGGDGGDFTANVKFRSPSGLAVSAGTIVFVADTGNHRIRAANGTGAATVVAGVSINSNRIQTVVGTGTAGFSGEGGAPNAAAINQPRGVVLDAAADVFFADAGNDRIRAVRNGTGSLVFGAVTISSNTIQTIVGGGTDTADHRASLSARLVAPRGLALDGLSPPNAYVADSGTHRVRLANARPSSNLTGVATDQGGTITIAAAQIATVAGTPPAGLQVLDPRGAALRGTDFYFADAAQNQVLKIDLATRALSVVAGTGQAGYAGDGAAATAATLSAPSAVSLDSAGTLLLVADSGNNAVRVVNLGAVPATAYGKTVAAGAIDTVSAAFLAPLGLFVDAAASAGTADDVFVADTGNHRIQRIARTGGTVTAVAGTGTQGYNGDGGAATAANLDSPWGVCVLTTGVVAFSDTLNERIRAFPVGGNISTVAGTGTAGFNGDGILAVNAQISGPAGILPLAGGTFLLFDRGNHCLRRIDGAGVLTIVCGTGSAGYNGDWKPGVNTQLNLPFHGALDAAGNLYFSDGGNKRIRRFKP